MSLANIKSDVTNFFVNTKVEVQSFASNPKKYVSNNKEMIFQQATKVALVVGAIVLTILHPTFAIGALITFSIIKLKIIKAENVSKVVNTVKAFIENGGWGARALAVTISLCFVAIVPLHLSIFIGGLAVGVLAGSSGTLNKKDGSNQGEGEEFEFVSEEIGLKNLTETNKTPTEQEKTA